MLPSSNYNLRLESKCTNPTIKSLHSRIFDLSMKRKQIILKPDMSRSDFHDVQEISAKIQNINKRIEILELEDSVCESDFDLDSKEYDV
jgi:hypothetical protein